VAKLPHDWASSVIRSPVGTRWLSQSPYLTNLLYDHNVITTNLNLRDPAPHRCWFGSTGSRWIGRSIMKSHDTFKATVLRWPNYSWHERSTPADPSRESSHPEGDIRGFTSRYHSLCFLLLLYGIAFYFLIVRFHLFSCTLLQTCTTLLACSRIIVLLSE